MRLKRGSRMAVFAAIAVLVLAQVAWWATVFIRDAELIAQLQLHNAELTTQKHSAVFEAEIARKAFHRKVMFLSESFFFSLITCLGLYLLYRAIRAERRSRVAQRNFIEIVSHESKTPLTALKLRLESLKEKATDAELSVGLGLALEEVRRLSGVLEKTMDLNRSERQSLQFESLRLAEVVESVLHRLEPWLASKKVSLYLDLDTELFVRGDFASLQNSVQSLVENAVHYNLSETKEVSIALEGRGPRISLRVSDNGPGISAADRKRVFERFYRGEKSRAVSGTGLGLYLAKVIVEAHRGALHLVDVARGACFEMELPSAEAV